MDELLKNNKVVIFAVVAGVVLLMIAVCKGPLMDKIADHVIMRLSKEYSPSPYGPGLDPDKVNPNVFNQQAAPSPKSNSQAPWQPKH